MSNLVNLKNLALTETNLNKYMDQVNTDNNESSLLVKSMDIEIRAVWKAKKFIQLENFTYIL